MAPKGKERRIIIAELPYAFKQFVENAITVC
jgi:hypothetical protein